MAKFNKESIKEIQDILYNGHVHDAKIENLRYNHIEDFIQIDLFNPIFNCGMCITFHNVIIFLEIKGKANGRRDTIISLTAEDDFLYLQNYLPNHCEDIDDSLYLLFQMFSDDELHIVSKEVSIDIVR